MMLAQTEYVGVADYFSGKNLFITGCTGFVGKVLLEKILRSIPRVGHIYVLGRSKRNLNIRERFKEIFKSILFDNVRSQDASVFDKIKFIEGDLLEDQLGISDSDRDELRRNVHIVIHSAASVRFVEPLRNSVDMNLKGTMKVLELCSSMDKLEVLQHVSTCYANCDKDVIEEYVYDQKYTPQEILEIVNTSSDEQLEKLQDDLLGGKPNVYTFTKSLTELMVKQFHETAKFSVSIVRPSIVVASMSEPVPGWVDNFNGPSGIVCAAACGFLRSMYSKRELRTDFIPVDVVANTILAATWKAGVSRTRSLTVYNCASGNRAPPFTWEDFESFQGLLVRKITFESAIRYPQLKLRSNWALHKASMFLEHFVPAIVGDGILNIVGRKPFLGDIYRKLTAMQDALNFFTTHEWQMKTDNVEALDNSLSEADRKLFNIDVSGVRWHDFLQDYVRGLRDFVIKENHKVGSSWFQHLYMIQQAQNALLVFVVYKVFGIGELLNSSIGAYF